MILFLVILSVTTSVLIMTVPLLGERYAESIGLDYQHLWSSMMLTVVLAAIVLGFEIDGIAIVLYYILDTGLKFIHMLSTDYPEKHDREIYLAHLASYLCLVFGIMGQFMFN